MKTEPTTRTIKFRAWDNGIKKMTYDNFSISPKGSLSFYWQQELFHSARSILMQYTGLNDKNGKEIYEGDLVGGHTSDGKIPTNCKPVIFKNGCFEWNGQPLGWDLDEPDEETGKIGSYDTKHWAVVVGNIFQNQDLIN